MCLERLSDKLPPATGHGWKIFKTHGAMRSLTGLHSLCKDEYTPRPIGQWIVAVAATTYPECLPEHDRGFHIYADDLDAKYVLGRLTGTFGYAERDVVLRKVLYRAPVAQGYGDGGFTPCDSCLVIVARQIYIPATDEEIFALERNG